jgi:hypothetical protein
VASAKRQFFAAADVGQQGKGNQSDTERGINNGAASRKPAREGNEDQDQADEYLNVSVGPH